MVTKGIITELVGLTQAKVRIPIFDKSKAALDGTPDSELSTAIMCAYPGEHPNYSVGDVVVVAFEQDIFTSPVIVGLLYTATQNSSFTDITAGKLEATLSAQLPADTFVDGVPIKEISEVGYYIEGNNNLVLVGIKEIQSPVQQG